MSKNSRQCKGRTLLSVKDKEKLPAWDRSSNEIIWKGIFLPCCHLWVWLGPREAEKSLCTFWLFLLLVSFHSQKARSQNPTFIAPRIEYKPLKWKRKMQVTKRILWVEPKYPFFSWHLIHSLQPLHFKCFGYLIHPGAISNSMKISWNVRHWGTLSLEFLLLNSGKDTLLVKF